MELLEIATRVDSWPILYGFFVACSLIVNLIYVFWKQSQYDNEQIRNTIKREDKA
tara:strand:- start:1509 stop:1673 length:165 start_codon:yes stop_codon:yes gene_type:complete